MDVDERDVADAHTVRQVQLLDARAAETLHQIAHARVADPAASVLNNVCTMTSRRLTDSVYQITVHMHP